MFFDIGANVGNWAKANMHKCEKIIAIEASPITFNKLVDNCKDTDITLLNYAVCNNNGEDITFYHANCDVLSTMNKEWLTSENSRFCNQEYTQIRCKTITIDNLIKTYGLPELIKIDVEGGEYQCISSLTQKVRILCFEWASELNEITFNCIDYLSTLGFTKFYMQNGDDYRFMPNSSDYYDIDTVKSKLNNTVEKIDWGMIWCK
jgi:FkbM family methyltransferase